VANFDGGRISSDGGLLLLREVAQRTGLLVLQCYKMSTTRAMLGEWRYGMGRAIEAFLGATAERFRAYVERLAQSLGHADRREPLRGYLTGLVLPGARKSVEPMAALLAPTRVRQTHQSLHHLVADAPWEDAAVLQAVREYALAAIQKRGPIEVWIVDDTGMPKKGQHSVGVARQYCGQLGKRDNCQVAVTLAIANDAASLPIAYQLYLPEVWASDRRRRGKAGVPEELGFLTKPKIALRQITTAVKQGVPVGVVLADAAYGNDSKFRHGLEALGLEYVLGVQSTTTVRPVDNRPLAPPSYRSYGRPPQLLRRAVAHKPLAVRALALRLVPTAYRTVSWREGTAGMLRSRFAAVRVHAAHRSYGQAVPNREQWLLIEWPKGTAEPAKYWLANLVAATPLKELVRTAKRRWRIERDFQELKQELGLNHFEGRSWRGFHHHATLCIAAYGFLVAERCAFSPGGPLRRPSLSPPCHFRPRGAPAQTAAP
jgi:SRSO17 transposase